MGVVGKVQNKLPQGEGREGVEKIMGNVPAGAKAWTRDLPRAGKIPSCMLRKLFRQASGKPFRAYRKAQAIAQHHVQHVFWDSLCTIL